MPGRCVKRRVGNKFRGHQGEKGWRLSGGCGSVGGAYSNAIAPARNGGFRHFWDRASGADPHWFQQFRQAHALFCGQRGRRIDNAHNMVGQLLYAEVALSGGDLRVVGGMPAARDSQAGERGADRRRGWLTHDGTAPSN